MNSHARSPHTHTRGLLFQLSSPAAVVLIPPLPAATSRRTLSAPAASTSWRRAASKGEAPRARGSVAPGSILGSLVPPAKHPTPGGVRPDSRLKSSIDDAGACHKGGAHSGGGSTLVQGSETGEVRGQLQPRMRATSRRRTLPAAITSKHRGSTTTTKRLRATSGRTSRTCVPFPGRGAPRAQKRHYSTLEPPASSLGAAGDPAGQVRHAVAQEVPVRGRESALQR